MADAAGSPKFLYYFANSPAGGGLVRLQQYLRFIKGPDNRFAVSSRCVDRLDMTDKRIICTNGTDLQRLFNENRIVDSMDVSESVVFSNGAPITPQCKGLVLHINNALPFVARTVKLNPSLKLRMLFLGSRLRRTAEVADLITVGSAATKALVEEHWGPSIGARCRILTNGVEPISESDLPPGPTTAPFALTNGSFPYKRLELVYAAFEKLLAVQLDLKLVIVDTPSYRVPLPPEHLIRLQRLSHLEMRGLVARCRYYITMSEIENCSVALLEAIHYGRSIVCSSIPSHLEFLVKHGYIIRDGGKGTIAAEPPAHHNVPVPTWQQISEETSALLNGLSGRSIALSD